MKKMMTQLLAKTKLLYFIPIMMIVMIGLFMFLNSDGNITGNVVGGNDITGDVVANTNDNPNTTTGATATFVEPDTDGDGVIDVADSCADTPTGDAVNDEGCSCAQVTVDDGNVCTDDLCESGVVTHNNNEVETVEFTSCPTSYCEGTQRIIYTESGYSQCSNGDIEPYVCEIVSSDFDSTCSDVRLTRGGNNNPTIAPVNPVPVEPVGVPEFSTTTFLVAMLGSMLGVVALRRKD